MRGVETRLYPVFLVTSIELRSPDEHERQPSALVGRDAEILAIDAEALVNTVNCVGHMGRGVALQFKKSWPANFQAYATACQRQEVRPGRMFVFETGQLTNPRFIINFPTKRHWRGKSRLVRTYLRRGDGRSVVRIVR